MEVITKMQPISTLTNNMARIDIVVNIVAGCGVNNIMKCLTSGTMSEVKLIKTLLNHFL